MNCISTKLLFFKKIKAKGKKEGPDANNAQISVDWRAQCRVGSKRESCLPLDCGGLGGLQNPELQELCT